jgi:histidinol-phosphate/aromatic aminotransferase/cobyric acid decarboxylase-like protein
MNKVKAPYNVNKLTSKVALDAYANLSVFNDNMAKVCDASYAAMLLLLLHLLTLSTHTLYSHPALTPCTTHTLHSHPALTPCTLYSIQVLAERVRLKAALSAMKDVVHEVKHSDTNFLMFKIDNAQKVLLIDGAISRRCC